MSTEQLTAIVLLINTIVTGICTIIAKRNEARISVMETRARLAHQQLTQQVVEVDEKVGNIADQLKDEGS